MPAELPRRYTFSPISMVSISSAAPPASRIWRVAFMISGPMPSPWATVMGVLVAMEYNRIPYDWLPVLHQCSLIQFEANIDRSERLHGLSVQQGRLILPLA